MRDSMARMSKAQARKRLIEARSKCGRVFMAELGAVPTTFNRDLFSVMLSLDKLHAKLK